MANFRVLIADDDGATARRLLDFLKEKGFDAEHVANGKMAKEEIQTFKPHFIICDLTLTDLNALQLLKWLKETELGNKPKVLVTSAHSIVRNIKECIAAGASDFLIKPFTFDDILTRLVYHIQNKRELATDTENKAQSEAADVYLNLMDVVFKEILTGRQTDDILYNVTKLIGLTLRAVRCSLIKVAEDLQSANVMASSDNRNVKHIRLDMNKYPEVLHVMSTGKAVVIEDLQYDPQLAKIKDLVKGISFNSMIVCPVTCDGEMYGVISARMDREHSKFNERDIRWVQLVGQAISLFVSAKLTFPHELLKMKKIEKTDKAA